MSIGGHAARVRQLHDRERMLLLSMLPTPYIDVRGMAVPRPFMLSGLAAGSTVMVARTEQPEYVETTKRSGAGNELSERQPGRWRRLSDSDPFG